MKITDVKVEVDVYKRQALYCTCNTVYKVFLQGNENKDNRQYGNAGSGCNTCPVYHICLLYTSRCV